MTELVFLPIPRALESRAGYCKLKSGKRIALLGAPAQELLFSGQRLQDALRKYTGTDWTLAATATGARDEIGAVLRVDPTRAANRDSYELDITPQWIEVVARTTRGIFYAVSTLNQLIAQ
jgi:N-acetyl-beta-hexosaminidase